LPHDLFDAVDAAAELVQLGKDRWDDERPLRLTGEAVIGRLAISPASFRSTSSMPLRRFPGPRSEGWGFIVDHAYHRINYQRVWATLRDDVPDLALAIEHWRFRQQDRAKERENTDLGFGF
jgi:hypothetical protein